MKVAMKVSWIKGNQGSLKYAWILEICAGGLETSLGLKYI